MHGPVNAYTWSGGVLMRGPVGFLCVARWGARGESGLRNCERPPLAYVF